MDERSTEVTGTNGPTDALEVASGRLLSAEQFQRLSDVPAILVWLANIDNKNTQRAYQSDVEAFVAFCGIEIPR